MLACAIAASAVAQNAPLGDVYSSGSANNSTSGQFRGVIISITPIGINRVDVKLQNPANGDIHSVTVEADVAQGLQKGQRVTQYKDPETGETMLAPTMLVPPGQSVPGQARDSGSGSTPTSVGETGSPLPTNPYTGGTSENGIPPSYPSSPPPYTGGATGGGSAPTYPSYPAPRMVGNLTGSGIVNGIPVTIGGGPNTNPVPAGSPPGTPITASNQTGQGNWKIFSGTLQSDSLGYYVQFNQGYFQGMYNGQYRNGWFPIAPQLVRLNAS